VEPAPGQYLSLAARLALRAAGDVEPNPMVGAVIVRSGHVIGLGHHRAWGGLHAEREALADCRRRGHDPRGSTVYVTLEPCCHHGKQPPCTEALIEAGVARVVAARHDPNPLSRGGAAVLARSGIPCEFSSASDLAVRASDPFIKRVQVGLPWVIAKWAQTADGRLTTRPDEPRWISGHVSRHRVHRLRARVDAIVTGIGTVLADDPMLTARGVRVHRVAQRIVIDPGLALPPDARLARSAHEASVVAVCTHATFDGEPERRAALERAGVRVLHVPGTAADQRLDLRAVFKQLAELNVSTVLLESGPRLLQAMFEADLVDMAIVHVAPPPASVRNPASTPAGPLAQVLTDTRRFTLCRSRRSGEDAELTWRRAHEPDAAQAPS